MSDDFDWSAAQGGIGLLFLGREIAIPAKVHDSQRTFALRLACRIDGFQAPLISGGVEADVKVIAPPADCITENHGLSYPFRMNQIYRGYVISMLFPSECPKEGVRGPAAVDHECIDGFSNLLKHLAHRAQCTRYLMLGQLLRIE